MKPEILALYAVEAVPDPAYDVAPTLPEEVRIQLANDYELARLYAGKGKRNGDTTEVGYDAVIMERLLGVGVTRPAELVTACAHRPTYQWPMLSPDDQSRLVRRLSRQAEVAVKAHADREAKSVRIERLIKYQTTPPTYEVVTRGVTFAVTASELLNVKAFGERYFQALDVTFDAPKPAVWRAQIDALMATATRVELPPEASAQGLLETRFRDRLERTALDEDLAPDALARGLIVEVGGEYYLSHKPTLDGLRAEVSDLTTHDFTHMLRRIGCAPATIRWAERQVRVWRLPVTLLHLNARGENSCEQVASISESSVTGVTEDMF